jgi:DNA-binding NarL/FixJ family response regulator
MRDGLKTIFDLEDDMEVIAVAENGEQALQLTRDLHPDIVLMDMYPVMGWGRKYSTYKKQFPGHCHHSDTSTMKNISYRS